MGVQIGKIINGYKILKQIGTGGMADVYYAENSLELPAAIKILKIKYNDELNIRERFVQEAKIMKSLDHPNIRKVIDLAEIDGQAAIIMEYLDGCSLKENIETSGAINDDVLKKYFSQCVSALNYTHKNGIIHRDLKPSNIFITKDDQVKLLDFGIAKWEKGLNHTITNQTLGTILYMSPEQVYNPKKITFKSDIYSLGVTFYHALTGEPPYDYNSESEFSIQRKIIEEPLNISLVPTHWKNILEKCLTKDADKRYNLSDINLLLNNDKTIVDTKVSAESKKGSLTAIKRKDDNNIVILPNIRTTC